MPGECNVLHELYWIDDICPPIIQRQPGTTSQDSGQLCMTAEEKTHEPFHVGILVSL